MSDGALPMIPEMIPGLGGREDRPRLNQAADLTAYRLTPVEGFVLSRVDGTVSFEEICLITGLGIVSPIGIGPDEFWKNAIAGRPGVGFVTLFDASNLPRPCQIVGEVRDFVTKD